MNRSETAQVLHIFHTVYRTEITDDTVSLWANVFAQADPNVVADAAREWVLTETWFPTPAGFSTYMRTARADARAALPATHGCDGSAWIDHPDVGLVPCPVCNPSLADIFHDRDKIRQWKNGTKIGTLTTVTDIPPTCVPSEREDPSDPIRRRPIETIRL